MAALGDKIRVIPLYLLHYRNAIANGAQPTGNGPISNVAPFLATPGALILCNDQGGAAQYRDVANDSGIWSFYELGPGRYFATEAGVSRQWQIDVAADLSFTVTPVTSSFPFNASSGYIG